MCWRSLSYWRVWGPLFSLWSFSLLYLPSLQESWLHTSCLAQPTRSQSHVQPSGHRPFVKSLLYRVPVLYRWFLGHFNAELWSGILPANKCHEWKGETSQSLSRTLIQWRPHCQRTCSAGTHVSSLPLSLHRRWSWEKGVSFLKHTTGPWVLLRS